MSSICAKCGASIAAGESKAYVKVMHVRTEEMGDDYGSWSGRRAKVLFSSTICDECLAEVVEDVRGAVA